MFDLDFPLALPMDYDGMRTDDASLRKILQMIILHGLIIINFQKRKIKKDVQKFEPL
jgi:hypothetical protein